MHGDGQDNFQNSWYRVPPAIKSKLYIAVSLLGYQVPAKLVIFINSSINRDNYWQTA